jgi:cephalosporin hydroxylase
MMAKFISEKIHGYDTNPYEGLSLLPKDDQGWGSTDSSFEEIIKRIKPKRIFEVGSWKGGSAINMANLAMREGAATEELEIVCIDTWLGSVEHYDMEMFNSFRKNGRPLLYEQFLSNIVHEQKTDIITPFPIDSVNASECLKKWEFQADLVYIDAGHDYNSVRTDLTLYSTLVRVGGYILIDDWHHAPIKAAAHHTFGVDKVFEVGNKAAWIR